MLSGGNGSGKSSIFDAMTYALFGHHRGGSQNASELINKESNALEITFDFLLDGSLYRIKRTLKRTKSGSASGTTQVYRAIDHGNEWEAVEDTNKRVDFDRWIHEKIGLNYETFTSSVLLLQGKAEKLLDSKPSGRAEVLAGIVNLERYQKLHERANLRKNALKGLLDSLNHQTKAIPEVTDQDYQAAIASIEQLESEHQAALQKLDELRELEIQSRRWQEAIARLDESRDRLKRSEYLLGSALKIEKAYARLLELRDVLPAAYAVVTTRGKLQESEQRTARYTKERDQATQRQTEAETMRKTALQKRDTLRAQSEQTQQSIRTGNDRLRELAAILRSVELAEDQQTRITDCERQIAQFTTDPVAALAQAQAEFERIQEFNRVLPILKRIHEERNELRVSRTREIEAERKSNEIRAQGETAKARLKTLESELDSARNEKYRIDNLLSATEALVQQAEQQCREFASLSGEKTCRACGQLLTPDHFEHERERRESSLRSVRNEYSRLKELKESAGIRERECTARHDAAVAELERLRSNYRDVETERKQSAIDAERHLRTLKIAYHELPHAFAQCIAASEPIDWLTTNFPDSQLLSRLKSEVATLDSTRHIVRSAQESLDRWKRLQADKESAQRSLDKIQSQIPHGDMQSIRREYIDLQSSEAALQNTLKSLRSNLESVENEIERLGKESHIASTIRTEMAGKLQTEEVTRQHCRETIEREMKKLSADWQTRAASAGLNEYHTWKSEHDTLIADETEQTHRKLEQARASLENLRSEIITNEQAVASFPEIARQHPDQVRMQIIAAKANVEERERDLNTARQRKATYDFHRSRRAELDTQVLQTDAEYGRYATLSELLGRDRLQRFLVRQAERQIVDYANSVLDRISGGQLYLHLTGSDDGVGADRALELECSNRVTGGSPIPVMFLSGSQKFRVAVSLALGIGQYASRQHRPIESVIIDEGFGCLDRQGRQVMIQEMHNLRGHLRCILLVSHQEEFAEAFHDGYRVELVDGSTKVTRFQR